MSVRRLYSTLERSWTEAQGLFVKSTWKRFFPHTIEFSPSPHSAASSSPHSDSSSSSAQPPQPPSYFPGYPAPTPTHSLHNHFACELSSFSFLCVLFSLYLPCCCCRFRTLESFSSLFSIFSVPFQPSSAQPCLNVLPFSAFEHWTRCFTYKNTFSLPHQTHPFHQRQLESTQHVVEGFYIPNTTSHEFSVSIFPRLKIYFPEFSFSSLSTSVECAFIFASNERELLLCWGKFYSFS